MTHKVAFAGGTPVDALRRRKARGSGRMYPWWFLVPGGIVYLALFIVPTISSVFFGFTRWDLFDIEWVGFDNYPSLVLNPRSAPAFVNTAIFTLGSAGIKVVLGPLLGALFASSVFGRNYLRIIMFTPLIVTTIGIGFAWKALLNPTDGIVNRALAVVGIDGPGWLTDPHLVIYTLTAIDVWRGIGIAGLIYLAGIVAIPREYFEAARVDGASWWQSFRHITLPLLLPATTTVVVLTLIHGLRQFELVWAITQGGPGFASDVISSVVYKFYQSGFYGLATAGNVVILAIVAIVVLPIFFLLTRKEPER